METQELKFEFKTRKGYDFFEVISALQKAIRRCEEENAVYWALELYKSGFSKALWNRLLVITSEDVGLAESGIEVSINALYNNYLALIEKKKDSPEALLPTLHAVVLLARAKKSRYIALLCEYDEFVGYDYRDMPDEALDKHTRRGKAKGRGLLYFYKESAKLNNAKKEANEEEIEQKIVKKLSNV